MFYFSLQSRSYAPESLSPQHWAWAASGLHPGAQPVLLVLYVGYRLVEMSRIHTLHKSIICLPDVFQCSVKCGKGVRQRTVRCTNPRKKCVLSTRPREAEDCEDYSKCYLWRMGDWSKVRIILHVLGVGFQ